MTRTYARSHRHSHDNLLFSARKRYLCTNLVNRAWTLVRRETILVGIFLHRTCLTIDCPPNTLGKFTHVGYQSQTTR